jgi:serine protease Do
MTRTLTFALLLAGLALPAISSEIQPDGLSNRVPGYFYSAGRSYLGVDITDVTSDRMSALKLKEERGVVITMVDNDAPAGKAGLKENDVILEFNGTAVESGEQLRRLLRETPPGRTVALGISRDGAPLKISVQLADHSKVVANSRIIIPPMPPMQRFQLRNGMDIPNIQVQTYSYALGVQTESLTRQLGEYFGVKNGEGILIRSVEKGSAADKAGLKAGDVIVRADNEKLTDRTDLSHALRNHRSGGPLNLVVVRDKREQNITVTLPDRGSRDSSRFKFESEDERASLDDAMNMLADEDGELASIGPQMELLEIQPQAEKAMRDAEKEMEHAQEILKHLKIGSDFI